MSLGVGGLLSLRGFFTIILHCYLRVAYKFMELFLLDCFEGLPGNTSIQNLKEKKIGKNVGSLKDGHGQMH